MAFKTGLDPFPELVRFVGGLKGLPDVAGGKLPFNVVRGGDTGLPCGLGVDEDKGLSRSTAGGDAEAQGRTGALRLMTPTT